MKPNLNFPIGLEDIDLIILFEIEDLNEVISLYNESRIIRLMLDKPNNFRLFKKRYNLYSSYVHSVKDLAILKEEIKKIVTRKRKIMVGGNENKKREIEYFEDVIEV